MFKIAYRRVADVSPFVYLPGAAGLTLGMAATLTSGALAKGTASVKPTHRFLTKNLKIFKNILTMGN